MGKRGIRLALFWRPGRAEDGKSNSAAIGLSAASAQGGGQSERSESRHALRGVMRRGAMKPARVGESCHPAPAAIVTTGGDDSDIELSTGKNPNMQKAIVAEHAVSLTIVDAHAPEAPSTNGTSIMAADKMDIIHSTLLDNVDEKLVEFMGEVDGEEYQFGVQYAVIEALSGDAPEENAIDEFHRFEDAIADAGLVALARNSDPAMIVISENDLE